MLLCAVAPTVGALVALRTVQGLGGAFALVIAYAYTRDVYSGRAATRAFATLLLVTGVAPIVAPVAGAGIIGAAGWRWVFAAMFAYISGAPFVLGDLFGITTSQFSLVFAANALGLVIAAQISGRAPFAPITMMRSGVLGVVTGGASLLLLTALGAGLWPTLVSLFVAVSSVGLAGVMLVLGLGAGAALASVPREHMEADA